MKYKHAILPAVVMGALSMGLTAPTQAHFLSKFQKKAGAAIDGDKHEAGKFKSHCWALFCNKEKHVGSCLAFYAKHVGAHGDSKQKKDVFAGFQHQHKKCYAKMEKKRKADESFNPCTALLKRQHHKGKEIDDESFLQSFFSCGRHFLGLRNTTPEAGQFCDAIQHALPARDMETKQSLQQAVHRCNAAFRLTVHGAAKEAGSAAIKGAKKAARHVAGKVGKAAGKVGGLFKRKKKAPTTSS